MPRKRLISGICLARTSRLGSIPRRAPGHLAPKPVGREINLIVPQQIALFAYARVSETSVVFPGRVNSCVRLFGTIHFALEAIIKADPHAVSIEDADFS